MLYKSNFLVGVIAAWAVVVCFSVQASAQNDAGCVFRPKPATDSDASRPPVPTERGH